jgi:hypothetical protein
VRKEMVMEVDRVSLVEGRVKIMEVRANHAEVKTKIKVSKVTEIGV